MARYTHETKTQVWWVVTIGNKAAPTAAEITAGTALGGFISKDGVQVNYTTNKVDSATLTENFNSEIAGSTSADVALTMFRDDTADTAWNLWVLGTNGFLVIRRGVLFSTAATAAQKVEVYPAQMLPPVPDNSAQDTQVRFIGGVAVTSEPNLKAVVA